LRLPTFARKLRLSVPPYSSGPRSAHRFRANAGKRRSVRSGPACVVGPPAGLFQIVACQKAFEQELIGTKSEEELFNETRRAH
jgi:hypothetical protein